MSKDPPPPSWKPIPEGEALRFKLGTRPVKVERYPTNTMHSHALSNVLEGSRCDALKGDNRWTLDTGGNKNLRKAPT